MSQNPNWPRLQTLWAPSGHIGYGTSAPSYDGLPWIDITPRLIGPGAINRGRQYELDQVTSGTWTGTLDNRDGLFDPNNTASGLSSLVVPYTPFRVRAQWPVTANLLTRGQGIDVAQTDNIQVTPQQTGWAATGGVTSFIANYSASAYVGAWVLEAAVAKSSGLWVYLAQPVTAGLTYSFQIRARTTAGGSQKAIANIQFFTPSGAFLGTFGGPQTTVGTGWTQLSVTATAPAGTGYAWVEFIIPTASAAVTVQLCAAQLEQATAPTVYTRPGTWYNLFTGGIERFPQTWRHYGTLGQIQATAVDALALLSQSKLSDPFSAAVFHPAGGSPPTFAYMLGDQPGQNFTDATGNRQPAAIGISSGGPGTVSAGTSQASASPDGGFVLPAGATVVNITGPATFGSNRTGDPMSFIALPANAAGGHGPGIDGQGWTRMIAFRVLGAPVYNSAIWMATALYPGQSFLNAAGWLINPDLSVAGVLMDADHHSSGVIGSVDTGNWHIAWLGVAADGTSWVGGIDADYQTFAASPAYTSLISGGYWADYIGAAAWGSNTSSPQFNLYGEFAFAIEWPQVLTAGQAESIYWAWRTAGSGDSSGQRAGSILAAAGWTGPTSIAAGETQDMAAATDLTGTDAASALQAVTDTEGGVLYVDAAGNVVFTSRSARWSPPAATVVFGEDTAAGEWPFEDQPVFDYDPTLVTNLAEVTCAATGQVFTAQDFDSQSANGIRDRQVTSQSRSTQECQDKASFLVSRYRIPRTRVAALAVHPAANPAMWPTVLGLDIGSRAKAVRRPPAPARPVVVDGFVENLAWMADGTGEASLTVQISPADPTAYGRFDYSAFDQFVFAY